MVAALMAILWRPSSGQKVEKDGLDEDLYNKEPGKDAETRAKTARKNLVAKPLTYTVTEEVYFDIVIGNATKREKPYEGRIVIACFGEIVPITCLNFVSLAKGYKKGRDVLWYKNTPVHRVVKDFVIQMGDVSGKKGKGGRSIYGEAFQDENFKLSHRGRGWVSMANFGRDTNGSQFFILLQPARWLDGKHVVFGKVIKGMDVVAKIGDVDTYVTGKPKVPVKVVNSGIVGIASKYEIPENEIHNADDMAMV
nr:hypothetical protein BaRGS_008567 [Batillaria attramentaria]